MRVFSVVVAMFVVVGVAKAQAPDGEPVGTLAQRDVPLTDAQFTQYAREMEEVAIAGAAVARTGDRDPTFEATNNLTGGCENRHSVYRRHPEGNRCQQP